MSKDQAKTYEVFKKALFKNDPDFSFAGEMSFQAAYHVYLQDPSAARWRCLESEGGDATPSAEGDAEVLSFACLSCNRKLHLGLPLHHEAYRCPSCNTEYQPVTLAAPKVVFLVVHPTQEANTSARKEQRSGRVVPPHVRAALSTLQLHGHETFEEIRQAYHNVVKGYHPDKVAHLGPDLLRLAEERTKELNNAFEVLRAFYEN